MLHVTWTHLFNTPSDAIRVLNQRHNLVEQEFGPYLLSSIMPELQRLQVNQRHRRGIRMASGSKSFGIPPTGRLTLAGRKHPMAYKVLVLVVDTRYYVRIRMDDYFLFRAKYQNLVQIAPHFTWSPDYISVDTVET